MSYDPHNGLGHPAAEEKDCPWCHERIGSMNHQSTNVLQPWMNQLSFMQQTVLLTAMRGPDTVHKDHIVKDLCRWYRRCILYSAFEKCIFTDPHQLGGGSFTGPIGYDDMNVVVERYLKASDEIPLHFHLHLLHGAEILGYKHPDQKIRLWWYWCYRVMVNALHLHIESESDMDKRLGDNETNWKAAEKLVVPGKPEYFDDL